MLTGKKVRHTIRLKCRLGTKLREKAVSLKSFLSLLALLAWAGAALAHTDCYFFIGFGQGHYSRDLTHKLEDKLLDTPSIQGTTNHQGKSHPYQLGGGCQPWRYLAFELDYYQGFQTEVNTSITLCAEIRNHPLCTEPGLIRRRITLEGWEISAIGFLPLSERLFFTARLGALNGRARLTLSLPQASNKIQLAMEERGTIPIVGLGLLYRANRDFSLAVESKKFDGHSRTDQLIARWYF